MSILKLKNKTTGEWEEIQAIKGEQGPRGEQGIQGPAGNDAKINNVNTLNIEAGDNITLEQQGNTLKINSTGGGSGGTSTNVKEWVELENLTISETQKFNKTYDSSYDDYMCEIRVPKANGKISTGSTNILGNYGLYYKTLETNDYYPCIAILTTKKIINNTYLMSCAFGPDGGIAIFLKENIKIVDNVTNASKISINADLPAGTTIRVWAR